MTKTMRAALCAAPFVLAAPAIADQPSEQTVLWKSFQKWTVRSDKGLGYGCYMHANYPNGVGLRFGFDARKPGDISGYVIMMNTEWRSLVPGQQYSVQVKFDSVRNSGWSTWTGVASPMTTGAPALVIPFTNVDIFIAAAGGTGIHVTYQGKPVIDGNLPGSGQAVAELAACQQAMNAGRSTTPDPFRGSATPPHDPFTPL